MAAGQFVPLRHDTTKRWARGDAQLELLITDLNLFKVSITFVFPFHAHFHRKKQQDIIIFRATICCLIVKDKKMSDLVFEGWMFSSSPSLSSLEHPINDIWLLNCINKESK